MRVLAVSHSSEVKGGAEKSLLDLVAGVGNEVTFDFLLPASGPMTRLLGKKACRVLLSAAYMPGVSTTWCQTPDQLTPGSKFELLDLDALAEKIARELGPADYDLIYTNTAITPLGALLAARMGKPHVWHFREYVDKDLGWEYILPRPLIREFISDYTSIALFNSHDLKESHGLSDVKSEVIYNGPIHSGWRKKEAYAISGKMNIAVIGTLAPHKMQSEAIELMSRLSDLPVSLHLYGHGEREYVRQLRALCDQNRVKSSVLFRGHEKDINKIYLDNDVVLVPSRSEAFGRIVAEAMASGVPVIAKSSGGLTELIRASSGGLLYEPDQIEQLEEHVRTLYRSQDLRQELGKAGHAYAKEEFMNDIYARRMVQAFRSVFSIKKMTREAQDAEYYVRQAVEEELGQSFNDRGTAIDSYLDLGKEINRVKSESRKKIEVYRNSRSLRLSRAVARRFRSE